MPKLSKFRKKSKYTYVIVLLVCYRHAKFELGNSTFIFGKVMAKKMFKTDDIKYSNSFSPLFTTDNKTKITIGFPVMSCIEYIPFLCKNIQLKY